MRTIIIPLLLIVLLGLANADDWKPATIWNYFNCQNRECQSQTNPCEETDKQCKDQWYAYGACITNSSSCQQFAIWLQLNQNDNYNAPLDYSFQMCAEDCKPNKDASQNYYNRYLCQQQCAQEQY